VQAVHDDVDDRVAVGVEDRVLQPLDDGVGTAEGVRRADQCA